MRVSTFLLALLCAAAQHAAAYAWGDGGHRIICEALVAIDPKYRTFADACTAADHPRLRGAEHYVNTPAQPTASTLPNPVRLRIAV